MDYHKGTETQRRDISQERKALRAGRQGLRFRPPQRIGHRRDLRLAARGPSARDGSGPPSVENRTMGLIGQSRPSIVLRHLKLFRIPIFEQPSNGGRVNDSTNLTILAGGESESTAAAHATWRGRHRGTRAADPALRVLPGSLCAEMQSEPSQGMLFEQQVQLVLWRRRIVAQRMLHAADHANLQCARHLRANGGDFAAHRRLLLVARPKLLFMRTQRGLIPLRSPFTEHAEIARRVFIGPLRKGRLRDSRLGNYAFAEGPALESRHEQPAVPLTFLRLAGRDLVRSACCAPTTGRSPDFRSQAHASPSRQHAVSEMAEPSRDAPACRARRCDLGDPHLGPRCASVNDGMPQRKVENGAYLCEADDAPWTWLIPIFGLPQ